MVRETLNQQSAYYMFNPVAIIYPESQSAAPGDIVLFECICSNCTLVWNIGSARELSRSNLPLGHWVNSSGLVVQARPEMNGDMYRCVPITISVDGTALLATRHGIQRPNVTLTVTSSGKHYFTTLCCL